MSTPPPGLQSEPPRLPSEMPLRQPFAKQAALFSLLAPLFAIAINLFGSAAVQGNRGGMIILGGTCTLLILLGFVFGIVGLFGIRKHGVKGILGKALAGVCINGVLIFFMLIAIPFYLRAARHARDMQQEQQRGTEQQAPQ